MSLFRLYFLSILKLIPATLICCLFVLCTHCLFVCLHFLSQCSVGAWSSSSQDVLSEQWTVGVPELGDKPLVKWEGGGSNRVVMGWQWGGDGSGENFFLFLDCFTLVTFVTFETLANNCIWVRYRSSLFRLFFINIKINSSHNYCLFVCLVYILFVCLFTFFITMLSWCLKLEQSRCTQWTVNSSCTSYNSTPAKVASGKPNLSSQERAVVILRAFSGDTHRRAPCLGRRLCKRRGREPTARGGYRSRAIRTAARYVWGRPEDSN